MLASTVQEHPEWEDEADYKRFKRMMTDGHGSPFEHVKVSYWCSVPWFVLNEWLRHRFSAFNAESMRYVTVEPKFFVSEYGEVRTQTGKRMDYERGVLEPFLGAEEVGRKKGVYRFLYDQYLQILSRGVAREVAREVLPNSIYTKFVWTTDIRNLSNFLNQRQAPQALTEIRAAANAIEEATIPHYPNFFRAWNECGRPNLGTMQ